VGGSSARAEDGALGLLNVLTGSGGCGEVREFTLSVTTEESNAPLTTISSSSLGELNDFRSSIDALLTVRLLLKTLLVSI
jgi:hypothetical protein